MSLGDIFEKIKDVITGGGDDKEQQPQTQNDGGDILPASQDPLGDPADQQSQGGNDGVLPASQDPLGDPADQ